MDDDLAAEYDVIVLGTGLPECILAAAAARIGKTVLHLDRNEYYGGDWATFNFDSLKKWIVANEKVECSEGNQLDLDSRSLFSNYLEENETVCTIYPHINYENIKESYNLRSRVEVLVQDDAPVTFGHQYPSNAETDCISSTDSVNQKNEKTNSEVDVSHKTKEWAKEDLESQSRKFNLDLSPKLLFSRGTLVELLISSNIARYAEFKCISRVLTRLKGKLEQVPCSRADVFSTKNVSIVEKRMLMKFLTFCMDYNQEPKEYTDYENKTFTEFLKSRKMTPNVVHYIINSIAMVDETTSTLKGLEATQQFLNSLGRYGNTPFLWPLYGGGELPQCFCRLCAVFGGVYYLKRKAEALIYNAEKECIGIVTDKKRINCKFLVAESSYLTPSPEQHEKKLRRDKSISRAILLTNKSMADSEKEQLTFLRLPPCKEHSSVITVIEIGPSAAACPNDLYVVHLNCKQETSAECDLKPAINQLFIYDESSQDNTKPKILWSLYFNYSVSDRNLLELGKNIALTSGPNLDIDFDHAVAEAREIFQQLFPTEEFLPRAPDPEEIKLDDSDVSVKNGTVTDEVKTDGEHSEALNKNGSDHSDALDKGDRSQTSDINTGDHSQTLDINTGDHSEILDKNDGDHSEIVNESDSDPSEILSKNDSDSPRDGTN